MTRISVIATIAAAIALLTPTARSGTLHRPGPPPVWFVTDALCVHSGWRYTPRRVPGRRPEYVLWRRGYWRTWKLPYGPGSNGEGAWSATVGGLYGGGLSFTVGTWNSAGAPFVSSTVEIAAAAPAEQIRRAWVVESRRGNWGDWPQTARACGLR